MLLAASGQGYGGIERAALRLSQGIAEHGHQVDALIQTVHGAPSPRHEATRLAVMRFNTPSTLALPVAPALAGFLLRHGGDYDVVHVHNYHAPLALAAAALPGVTLVFSPHYHGRGRTWLRQAVHVPYRPLGQRIFARSAVVLCASAAEATLCRAHFTLRDDPLVVRHGVDAEAIAGAEPFACGGRVVLCVGRLETYKRFDRVIEALQYLGPPWRLVIAGTGPADRRLRALCYHLNLTGRVTFTGAISDREKHCWLRTAKVLVTLSTLEAYGLTVLEAIAGGLPVIASDIPAHREHAAAPYGAAVALVPCDVDPQAIAACISGATSHERSPDRRGNGLPTWEEAVRRTLGAYELAIHGRRAP